jgi:hypothetical protein
VIELIVVLIAIMLLAMIFGPLPLSLLLLAALFTYDSTAPHHVAVERPSN